MEPIINVQNLSFGYANHHIMNEVSFVVEPGEYIALTGVNGSGKSTLLKLLLGELPLQKGSITFFNQDIKEFNQWFRMGYLPQNALQVIHGFPANVLEIVTANLYSQIGRFRLPGKAAKAQAYAALEQVEMAEHARRMPDELSGGQQQRVLLARALVGKPEILILDEPMTGIDEQAMVSLYELLDELNRSGLTIFMVTHDMARVTDLASKTLCLEHGSLIPLSHSQQIREIEARHFHPKGESE